MQQLPCCNYKLNSSRFCNMVLQEGAVPPLVALSQSGTPRAREKAQGLLSYFRNQRHGNAGEGADLYTGQRTHIFLYNRSNDACRFDIERFCLLKHSNI
ncbi:hypothetical protein HAX54_035441 [Datura stramonium]|uniref:Uncharacterized protein n=1 Tax=Datura stramonium TaxID=4076 RepID=A0ABS8SFB2_DATST|nr:hypothetical protein [Datura stramonium]